MSDTIRTGALPDDGAVQPHSLRADPAPLTRGVLLGRPGGMVPTVDVIIPVYNGLALVKNCLASVINTQNTVVRELVVIDDGSTDRALKRYLQELADGHLITLITNAENLGFTKSVNLGMKLHRNRDALLLNSDTVVYGPWIDRLQAAAYSEPTIGTVNPLTNASHIGCYPYRAAKGDVTFEISDERLDQLAAEANAGRLARVHTTVGFCMYIKRSCLDALGYFDEVHFPYGYGEESDFCYRAGKIGWKHVITGDTFVRHWEGQTFGEKKTRLIADMLDVFKVLHPELAANDERFAIRDPVRPLRAALDLARVKHMLAGRTTVKGVLASQDLTATKEKIVFIYDPDARTIRLAVLTCDPFPNLATYRIPADIVRFNAMTDQLGIAQINFAHDDEALAVADATDRGLPFEVKTKVRLSSLAV